MSYDDLYSYVTDYLKKHDLYELYHDLCMQMDTVPVSEGAFTDIYVNILENHEELYKKALFELDNDKKQLLEFLEKEDADIEELVSVDSLPPSTTITVNEMKSGIICLYVLFPDKSTEPHIIPSFVSDEDDTAIFL